MYKEKCAKLEDRDEYKIEYWRHDAYGCRWREVHSTGKVGETFGVHPLRKFANSLTSKQPHCRLNNQFFVEISNCTCNNHQNKLIQIRERLKLINKFMFNFRFLFSKIFENLSIIFVVCVIISVSLYTAVHEFRDLSARHVHYMMSNYGLSFNILCGHRIPVVASEFSLNFT